MADNIKIVGNTVGVPNPRSDWSQTDPTKADYIKNKPDIESKADKEDIPVKLSDLADDITQRSYEPTSEKPQSGKAVAEAIAKLLGSAPENLDTLEELAKALNEDENFSASVLAEIAKKADARHIDDLGAAIDDTYLLAEGKIDKEENATLLKHIPIEGDMYVNFDKLKEMDITNGVHIAFGDLDGGSDINNISEPALVLKSYSDFETITVMTPQGEIYNTYYDVNYETDESEWTEWKSPYVTPRELSKTIGDIETSLDNIIKKYGLGGDSQ